MLDGPPVDPEMLARVEADCLKLCRALGYDLNTVEFAVEDGIPYAIDFLNPAPDADYHSVGRENFEWIVDAVARVRHRTVDERARRAGTALAAFPGSGSITLQMAAYETQLHHRD